MVPAGTLAEVVVLEAVAARYVPGAGEWLPVHAALTGTGAVVQHRSLVT